MSWDFVSGVIFGWCYTAFSVIMYDLWNYYKKRNTE